MNDDAKKPCGTAGCDDDAVGTVYWPGTPIDMCKPCIARARKVAAAMGFVMAVDPLRAEKE